MKQTCIVFWFLYCLLNQTVLTNEILALIKSFSFNKYAQGTEYMLDTCVGGHILLCWNNHSGCPVSTQLIPYIIIM